MAEFYPPNPPAIAYDKLIPSPAFKKQAVRVVMFILLFFTVYVLLLLIAVAFAIACMYGGLMLIATRPSFITIMLGLGLMGLGLAVFFFVIKFIFAAARNENSARVELTEAAQPELFAFIRQLTIDTQTSFPKKIYVSPDVNACVFYHSSFWSMFFPVRKNLEIGLGLVNSINLSEFKAVMAHEFGHFSQRSMKLGSFTYNVNRVIYNMLFENNGYNRMLQQWGSVSGYFALFANITIGIAGGIQWVLKQLYSSVNKSYMGLSREMEYHADAVAAVVSGGNNLVTALSRIEVAAGCYNTAMDNANRWLKEKRQTSNIFHHQLLVYRHVASSNQLPIKEGLPEISYSFIEAFVSSRINFKNQWASHPSLAERKHQLELVDVTLAADERSAWVLFSNPEALQQQVTDLIYELSEVAEPLDKLDPSFFEEWYHKETREYLLPEAYNGFYNDRMIDSSSWDLDALAAQQSTQIFDDLFRKENGMLYKSIQQNEADLATLQMIRNKEIDVKHFDFDGIKFGLADCDKLLAQLELEIKEQKDQLAELDQQAFVLFNNYGGAAADLKQLYKEFQNVDNIEIRYVKKVQELFNCINPFYAQQCNLDYIASTIDKMKSGEELALRNMFRDLIAAGTINASTGEDLLNRLHHYLGNDYLYFSGEEFHDNELQEMTSLAIKTGEYLFEVKRKLHHRIVKEQLVGYGPASALEPIYCVA